MLCFVVADAAVAVEKAVWLLRAALNDLGNVDLSVRIDEEAQANEEDADDLVENLETVLNVKAS